MTPPRASVWLKIAAGLAVLAATAFLGLAWWIDRDVDRAIAQAQDLTGKTGVEALLAVVLDEDQPLPRRNRAVWTLGRLADPAARRLLESELTGRPCDHARVLCQHELEKAVRRCGGTADVAVLHRGRTAAESAH